MRSFRVNHTRLLVLMCLGLAACAGSGGSGLSCTGCLVPIKQADGKLGNYVGPKVNNAIDAKITKKGFDYINQNWRTVLATLLTSSTTDSHGNPVINLPVACTVAPVNTAGVDDLNICDTNFSDSCNSGESCNNINITISNFVLNPQDASSSQGKISGVATLSVNTGDIPISTSNKPWECGLLGHIETTVTFNNSSDPITLTVPITLNLDQRVDPTHPLLGISVGSIGGLSGLNSNDVHFDGNNLCGSIYSGLLDAVRGTILNFVIDKLTPLLQSKVKSAVDGAMCRSCGGATDPVCPAGQNGGQSSSCQSGVCMIGSTCVPRLLGTEGVIQPGQSLGQYGVSPDAELAISAAAGGSVSSSQSGGLTLGVIGGAEAGDGQTQNVTAACVPVGIPPAGNAPPVPDFDGDAPADGGAYHVGLGISDYFLNSAAYAAQQSGTVCLAINGTTVSLLNTGLLKTFLPSLGLLAGTATQDAPVLVNLRPLQAPTIDIGEGTVDPVTQKPIDPLLTITMKHVVIDMYALIEDRWSRLFTMTVDVQLPLSLIVDGCPQAITPAIGDLSNLIQVTGAPTNSELLAEDPSVLQGLIPAVVGLAQPALASALKPIAIPSVSGFGLHVDGIKGIGARTGSSFDDLGIYGELRLGGACDAATVETEAHLVSSFIPTAAQMHPAQAGAALPWPTATIDVSATGASGDVEYDYRVDQGMWTTFKPGPQLLVRDPQLLIEGHHQISVRGRPAHDKGVADPTPAVVDFLVDWEPPVVHLSSQADGAFSVAALDNVSNARWLQYRYAVGDEGFSTWGTERPIDAQAIREAGKLTVQVRDEAGNVGQSTWTGATAVDPSSAR